MNENEAEFAKGLILAVHITVLVIVTQLILRGCESDNFAHLEAMARIACPQPSASPVVAK